MSKKKKKPVKRTLPQKLKQRLSGFTAVAAAAAHNFKDRAAAGSAALRKAMETFVPLRGSAALIALVFALLMLLTYFLFGHPVMTTDFAIAFPFSIPLYLVDYRVGFVSRALVGQIVALFTDTVSVNGILTLVRCAIALTLLLQAGIAAAAFKKAWLNKNPLVCVLCVFFVLSPVTVAPYMIYLGFLDPFNLLLAIFYVYISDTKAARLLTPVVCVAGIVLHYQFIAAFLPMILSLELYAICRAKQGRGLRIASLVFTVLLSAGVGAYLIFYSKYNVKMDADELYDYMCGKFSDYSRWGLFKEYFTYYIYGDYNGMNYSAPRDFISFLLGYARERLNKEAIIGYAATLVPMYAVMESLWIGMARRSEKERKLPWLVFMLQPLAVAVTMVISTDHARWAGASLFSNFALLFAANRNDGETLRDAARKLCRPQVLAPLCIILLAGYIYTLLTMRRVIV